MRVPVIAALGILVGCRGASPQRPQDRDIARLVDSLRPAVERAVGLAFKGPTKSAIRSREELRQVLLDKLRKEFPAAREEGVEAAYRLLGLLPDTLDLKSFLVDLYSEQVAGYYDPDTRTLYGIGGVGADTLRLVLAHELVHALQHDYLPLDSLMHLTGDADQQTAVQAVLEGHAMLASILAFLPDRSVLQQPGVWQLIREQARTQSATMKVFATAPLVLREELIFPYLNGTDFMRWWNSARPGHPLPTLAELPHSTEQILHPDRYTRGDQPVRLRFAEASDSALFEDTMGEREIQILGVVLGGAGVVPDEAPALGWGGDRFRVYRTPAGPALVWYIAWDDEAAAQRFVRGTGALLDRRERTGYRTVVEPVEGAGHPAVRVIVAPIEWPRWGRIPVLSR